MSRTKRWWNIKGNWSNINPYCFKHEYYLIRQKIHRAYRRCNKVRVKKGMDVIKEQKTNGWITY